jgi:hypothetical protein
MNRTKPSRTDSIVVALGIPLFLALLAVGAENPPAGQETSENLLLKIMDLHSQLVTNEVFVAQAKMLGAYLETAQPLEEAKKVKIYTTVLQIITKIKESPAQISARPPEKEDKSEEKGFEGEEKGKTVFVPGAALLEIFKVKGGRADSLENIPDVPVIRTYWKAGLAYEGNFLLPERLAEIGERSAYAGKFSFYYEAKQPGKYGFTIQHHSGNSGSLTIGGVEVVKFGGQEVVCQGVCNLEKGFHRLEFWLLSEALTERSVYGQLAAFQVKILTPDAFDAVPITKDMMLLKADQKKADQKKAAQVQTGEKVKGKAVPYIDY